MIPVAPHLHPLQRGHRVMVLLCATELPTGLAGSSARQRGTQRTSYTGCSVDPSGSVPGRVPRWTSYPHRASAAVAPHEQTNPRSPAYRRL